MNGCVLGESPYRCQAISMNDSPVGSHSCDNCFARCDRLDDLHKRYKDIIDHNTHYDASEKWKSQYVGILITWGKRCVYYGNHKQR